MKKNAQSGKGDFESSLSRLEQIVRELERGEMPLEKSLRLFEEGVGLSRDCQERLNEAERRVEVLLRGPEGRPVVADLGGGIGDANFDEDEEVAEEDESVF